MKKQFILSAVIAVAISMFSTSVKAQDGKFSFGLKASANSTFFLMESKSPYSNSSLGLGGSAGGYLKYDFGNWFALQTDIMFHYRNSELKVNSTAEKLTFESYSIELPVYAVFQFNLGTGKMFFGLGPYIGYGLNAKAGGVDMYKKDASGDTPMQQLAYGGAIMLGYNFGRHWQISASYISQGPLGATGTASMNPQTFSLGIGYSF